MSKTRVKSFFRAGAILAIALLCGQYMEYVAAKSQQNAVTLSSN